LPVTDSYSKLVSEFLKQHPARSGALRFDTALPPAAPDPTLHLGHIELFVRDPRTTAKFYIDALGFTLTTDQSPHALWLRSGAHATLLRPARPAPPPPNYRVSSSALVLYTSNLPAALRRLKQFGITCTTNDGSPNCPTFTDPDGNWLQLVDPKSH